MEQVSLVEFPGFMADPSDASGVVCALGGADALRRATDALLPEDEQTLTLTLRPGQIQSPSNVGSVCSSGPTNMFVLRIRSSRCVSAQNGSSAGERHFRGDLVYSVRNIFRFPGMSDFQYFTHAAGEEYLSNLHMAQSSEDGTWPLGRDGCVAAGIVSMGDSTANAIDDTGASFNVMWREKSSNEVLMDAALRLSREFRNVPAPDSGQASFWLSDMRPVRFAKTPVEEGAKEAWFREFALNIPETGEEEKRKVRRALAEVNSAHPDGSGSKNAHDINVDEDVMQRDGRKSQNRLHKLVHRMEVGATDVLSNPYGGDPIPSRIRVGVEYLQERFRNRPVWTRRALLHSAPESLLKNFRHAITRVAYAFATLKGPFSSVWIRYDYDPRLDAEKNRPYQIVELRFLDDLSYAAMRKKFGPRETEDALDIVEVGNFTAGDLPSKKQLALQICDIDASGVSALLRKSEYLRESFDETTGFLTREGVDAVTRIVRRRVQGHVLRILGRDAAKQLLVSFKGKKMRDRRIIIEKMLVEAPCTDGPGPTPASPGRRGLAPGVNSVEKETPFDDNDEAAEDKELTRMQEEAEADAAAEQGGTFDLDGSGQPLFVDKTTREVAMSMDAGVGGANTQPSHGSVDDVGKNTNDSAAKSIQNAREDDHLRDYEVGDVSDDGLDDNLSEDESESDADGNVKESTDQHLGPSLAGRDVDENGEGDNEDIEDGDHDDNDDDSESDRDSLDDAFPEDVDEAIARDNAVGEGPSAESEADDDLMGDGEEIPENYDVVDDTAFYRTLADDELELDDDVEGGEDMEVDEGLEPEEDDLEVEGGVLNDLDEDQALEKLNALKNKRMIPNPEVTANQGESLFASTKQSLEGGISTDDLVTSRPVDPDADVEEGDPKKIGDDMGENYLAFEYHDEVSADEDDSDDDDVDGQ